MAGPHSHPHSFLFAFIIGAACSSAAPSPADDAAIAAPEPPTQPVPAPDSTPTGEQEAPSPPDGDAEADATPPTCGGFAGLACPEPLQCVDDPKDDCSPKTGGADCGGICVDPDCVDPKRNYTSREPDMCARMRFTCPEGQSFFGDRCGCGCLAS